MAVILPKPEAEAKECLDRSIRLLLLVRIEVEVDSTAKYDVGGSSSDDARNGKSRLARLLPTPSNRLLLLLLYIRVMSRWVLQRRVPPTKAAVAAGGWTSRRPGLAITPRLLRGVAVGGVIRGRTPTDCPANDDVRHHRLLLLRVLVVVVRRMLLLLLLLVQLWYPWQNTPFMVFWKQ